VFTKLANVGLANVNVLSIVVVVVVASWLGVQAAASFKVSRYVSYGRQLDQVSVVTFCKCPCNFLSLEQKEL
jgi:hypothetical protein